MTFSLILIAFSLALFAYWFRYTCLLILRTQTAEDYASLVSRANGLSFDQVKSQLENRSVGDRSVGDLDILYKSLERDYRILSGLLDQVGADENLLESKLLRANFKFVQGWYRVSRSLGLGSASNALEEMAETISHFANHFGEQQASRSAA
jgi:hypothetical protein